MSNLAVNAINNNIAQNLENISIWIKATTQLLNLKYNFSPKTILDTDLQYKFDDLQIAITNYTCKSNTLSQNPDVNIEFDSSTESKNVQSTNGKSTNVNSEFDDIDNLMSSFYKKNIIQQVEKEINGRELTDEQIKTITELAAEEQSYEDLDAVISTRRKQMQEELNNPPIPNKQVVFKLDADDDSINGANSLRESINGANSLRESINGANSLPLVDSIDATKYLDLSANSIRDRAAKAVHAYNVQNNEGVVNFTIPNVDPPTVNALVQIPFSQRKKLEKQIYFQAKDQVELENPNASSDEKNELIRKLADKLLADYISTN